MQSIVTWFHKLRKNEDGFTLGELAVTIPIIVLLSSTFIYLMGNSIITANNNETRIEAADNVDKVLDSAVNANTCAALAEIADEENIGNQTYNAGTPQEYQLVTTVEFQENPLDGMNQDHTASWEGCNNSGGIAEVTVKAEKTAGRNAGSTLYQASRTVMPTGGMTGDRW